MDENENHAVDEPVTTPDLPARQPLGVQNKEDFPKERMPASNTHSATSCEETN
jgi:hypothetical protein